MIAAELRGARLGTVGHLFPEVQVRIDAPNEDRVGEILVRGPNVMQGYYNNPEATAEVLRTAGTGPATWGGSTPTATSPSAAG